MLPGAGGARPRVVPQDPRLHLDHESRELQRLPQARAIEDEPLEGAPPGVETRERRGQQRERQADRIEEEQVPTADAPERVQRAQRVPQHLEDEAHDDEVELAVCVDIEVVDASLAVRDRRTEQLGGERETSFPERLAPLRASRRGVLRPDVDGDDRGGAAAVELERSEAVHRAHVEAALAGDVRPRKLRSRRPQVPAARGDDSGREFDHVPPRVGGDTLVHRQATPVSRKARDSLSISRAITSRWISCVPS